MIVKVFQYKSRSFHKWLKTNDDVEKIILKGGIPQNELESFEKSLFNAKIKFIEFDDFVVQGFDKRNPFDRYARSFALDSESCSTLTKMLINAQRVKSFVISNQCVYSEDFKTLIHIPECETYVQPEHVEVIGACAFANYSHLKSVKLNHSLKIIDSFAFSDCEALTEIVIPDSVTAIGVRAFQGCNLEKVKLSKILQIIPEGCFAYNDLESIDIPSSVKEIQEEAFLCNYINKVIIPEGVEVIGYGAFIGIDYVRLPTTLKEIAKDFYYEEFIDEPDDRVPFIYVHANNPCFYSEEGSLYYKDSKKLVLDACYPFEEDDTDNCDLCEIIYGSGKSADEVIKQWRERAEKGDPDSQYHLGTIHIVEKWMKPNYDEGIKWIKKSAAQGYLPAVVDLADYYYWGDYVEKNPDECFALLCSIADKKDPQGLNDLASCYEDGFGTTIDLNKALEYYIAAVDAGYYQASNDAKRLEELLNK